MNRLTEASEIIEGEMLEETAIVRSVPSDLQVSRAPEIVLEEARKAAKALQDVIESKPKKVVLNGKTYLTFEDWQTVGRFYGVSVGVESTKYIEFGDVKGFEARAFAVVTSTGVHISAAEGMCLNDETNWQSKPLFQLRSMAQTRACAKAFRNVLAFVPVLAGYEGTPAEEMVERGSQEAADAVATRKIAEHTTKVEAQVTKPKINLPPPTSPSQTEAKLKESIRHAEERDAYVLSGTLMSAERKQGPKAKYLRLVISEPGKKESKADLFNDHEFVDGTKLFDLLTIAKSRFVSFMVKPAINPKFNPSVVRTIKIHTMEFNDDGDLRNQPKPIEPLPPVPIPERYTDEELGRFE
jgi:hypothetical protein